MKLIKWHCDGDYEARVLMIVGIIFWQVEGGGKMYAEGFAAPRGAAGMQASSMALTSLFQH